MNATGMSQEATFWLTTERLALRRFTPDDLDWLAALYADGDVARFIGGIKDRPAVSLLLDERVLQYYDAHPGLGVWMTVERQTGVCLGFHLLNHIQGEALIQVGYALTKPAWGRGYATEMALALLRYGFADMQLPHIHAIANVQNVPSHRVLQKIGLVRRGERSFAHPAYAADGPLAWFERDAADWLAERGRRSAQPLP